MDSGAGRSSCTRTGSPATGTTSSDGATTARSRGTKRTQPTDRGSPEGLRYWNLLEAGQRDDEAAAQNQSGGPDRVEVDPLRAQQLHAELCEHDPGDERGHEQVASAVYRGRRQ